MSGLQCPYTADEIAVIQKRFLTDGAQALAAELSRDVASIRTKAWQLGIRRYSKPSRRAKEWTAADDVLIRSEWPFIVSRYKKGRNAAWLAAQLGVSVVQLRSRATILGLRRAKMKDLPWNDDEIEALHDLSHLSVRAIYMRFRKLGFKRTETAIAVARSKHGALVTESDGAYTAHALSRLMGVSPPCVGGWIQRGLLKATPRSDAKTECGGVGDRWLIFPADVREFIRVNRGFIHIARCDQHWFLDLIFGDEGGPVKIQHSAGSRKAAAGGFSEHGVAA